MAKTKRVIARPVKSVPIEFEWQTGDWFDLFERHVSLIQNDLRRANFSDQLIIYLSCPISSRGGSHFRTNVDIANFTARRLMDEWGDRVFILVPSQYQLESKQGTGLIRQHAAAILAETGHKIDVDALMHSSPPLGGDYMRMWTRVLCEDGYLKGNDSVAKERRGANAGGLFDAFYFLGPEDVRNFFTGRGALSVTEGVEEYFSRKYAIDYDFRVDFEFTGDATQPRQLDIRQAADAEDWERRRIEYFRYYVLRASANFSLGSHDEWNIWRVLNGSRRSNTDAYGSAAQIAGFFDGRQIVPGATEFAMSPGYEK